MAEIYEREEEALEKALARGELTYEQFRQAMSELWHERRDAAHEAARGAYERELENW